MNQLLDFYFDIFIGGIKFIFSAKLKVYLVIYKSKF